MTCMALFFCIQNQKAETKWTVLMIRGSQRSFAKRVVCSPDGLITMVIRGCVLQMLHHCNDDWCCIVHTCFRVDINNCAKLLWKLSCDCNSKCFTSNHSKHQQVFTYKHTPPFRSRSNAKGCRKLSISWSELILLWVKMQTFCILTGIFHFLFFHLFP